MFFNKLGSLTSRPVNKFLFKPGMTRFLTPDSHKLLDFSWVLQFDLQDGTPPIFVHPIRGIT